MSIQVLFFTSLLHTPLFTKLLTPAELSQACFQPQNISYPQLLSPERKGLFSRASRFSYWGGSHSSWSDELKYYLIFRNTDFKKGLSKQTSFSLVSTHRQIKLKKCIVGRCGYILTILFLQIYSMRSLMRDGLLITKPRDFGRCLITLAVI